MGRSRRRHERFKTSKAKVGLLKRTAHKNPRKPEAVKLPEGDEVIEWAEKKTLQDNYEAVGLALNPNKIGASLGKRGDIVELVKVKDGKVVGLDEADDDPDEEEITDGKSRNPQEASLHDLRHLVNFLAAEGPLQ